MSLCRKITRSIERDDAALNLIALKGLDLPSEKRSVCLAGNHSAGIRRRAKRHVAVEMSRFVPSVKEVRVIEHKTELLNEETGYLEKVPFYNQEIVVKTQYNRRSILAKTEMLFSSQQRPKAAVCK